ncbi:MAG: polysaccharide deacetylase family protein [Patescibacteria group bacterium]|nr:MAG: polysaccharide deacetylase family protein [Patescibacteria group bacterium]
MNTIVSLKRKMAVCALVLILLSLGGNIGVAEGREGAKVSFTFDDAPKSVFDNAYPLLEARGFPATIYLTTKYIGAMPWYVTWEQVGILGKRGWEIGSHTHTHPHMMELTATEIAKELDESIKELRKRGFAPRSFSSPYGEFDGRVIGAMKARFGNHRRAWGGTNGLNDPVSVNPYDISAFELKHTTTFKEVKKLIDRAVKEESWLVFITHAVLRGEPSEYQLYVDIDVFRRIVDYVHKKGVKVVTVSDAMAKPTRIRVRVPTDKLEKW